MRSDLPLYLLAFIVAFAMSVSTCSRGGASVGLSQDAVARPVLRGLRQADALLAAQACLHENSYAGGIGGTTDCGAQISVFLARRNRGESLSDVILRTMPRFAAGTTSRAWVRAMPWGPLRENPPGWPALYPARHDDDRWHSVVLRVRGFLSGREPLPCVSPPHEWLGRVTDGDVLAERLRRGFVEIDCSGGSPRQTLEAYIARPGA